MRPNPVKRKLLEGGKSYGTFVGEFFTPGLPQILRNGGAEFAIFDMEHSGASIETLKQQFSYCRGIGLVPFARPPQHDYHFLARLLDVGAMGLEVPMVETAEQAREIVSFMRYPPLGRRGVAFGGSAHDDYQGGDLAELMAAENERTLLICLIETAQGIANADEIAAVDGVDVLWLGQVDLTCSMGIPGDYASPAYLEAVDILLAACKRHGKVAGMTPFDEAWARDYMRRGFRMVAWSSDTRMLKNALTAGISTLRRIEDE